MHRMRQVALAVSALHQSLCKVPATAARPYASEKPAMHPARAPYCRNAKCMTLPFKLCYSSSMPIDMKKTISEGAMRLMQSPRGRRMTVKDICAECGITRQAFYYHFRDIPDLIEWVLSENLETIGAEIRKRENLEDALVYLLSLMISTSPYLKRTIDSSYRNEILQVVVRNFEKLVSSVFTERGLYSSLDGPSFDFAVKYHTSAILALAATLDDEASVKKAASSLVAMVKA